MKSRRLRAAKARNVRPARARHPRRNATRAPDWRIPAARRLRREVIKLISPTECCAKCGSTDRLEVDHVDGVTWDRRQLSSLDRVLRYLREWTEGVPMRVLCRSCSARDGRTRWQGRPRYARTGRAA